MILWKKYYCNKFKKSIVKKKSIISFIDSSLIKFDETFCPVVYNDPIFLSLSTYFKLDLDLDLNQYVKRYKTLFIGGYQTTESFKKVHVKVTDEVQKYLNPVLSVVSVLEKIKTKFYQSCFFFLANYFFRKHDFLVFYIISFYFSSSNTNLHIMDSTGKSKIFYSAGLLNMKGKQKVVRKLVLVRLFNLLTLMKVKFIKNSPVALHLKNVGSNKFLIVKKLKRKFFIKIIKTFELISYNGCRKKKKRRKRQRKK